jgi:hypothetical protein
MPKIAGSGSESGSISQKHGSEDPDPPQNVMDPEHWSFQIRTSKKGINIFSDFFTLQHLRAFDLRIKLGRFHP